jgi:hypothetical protein
VRWAKVAWRVVYMRCSKTAALRRFLEVTWVVFVLACVRALSVDVGPQGSKWYF